MLREDEESGRERERDGKSRSSACARLRNLFILLSRARESALRQAVRCVVCVYVHTKQNKLLTDNFFRSHTARARSPRYGDARKKAREAGEGGGN